MAEALASSSSRNFWNEIKNVNRSCSQRPSHAPVVDGIHREEDIANAFSSKISSLLSSANSESSDSFLHQLTDHLTSKDLSSVSMSSSCIRAGGSKISLIRQSHYYSLLLITHPLLFIIINPPNFVYMYS